MPRKTNKCFKTGTSRLKHYLPHRTFTYRLPQINTSFYKFAALQPSYSSPTNITRITHGITYTTYTHRLQAGQRDFTAVCERYDQQTCW